MKVTYNWLKDFVEIKILAPALADKLTMAGLEVTSLEERSGDFIFEIEVTANRPDCLSVVGIAREIAAITNSKLKIKNAKLQFSRFYRDPDLSGKFKNLKQENLKIEIEDEKDCPLYTAKIIKDVKVTPSPEWMRRRLDLIGCRSVNNIVDITNYCLFTYGEPLHAFDLDKLSGEAIIVRRAQNGEKITAIDGEEKKLTPDILVIADQHRPVAIAGVMGGKDTEVVQSTRNILLEAAGFDQIVVRRSRQLLGLQSESAYRFERGVDLAMVEIASSQALKYIEELAQGNCVMAKSSPLPKKAIKKINLRVTGVEKIIGVNVTSGQTKKILNSLGFLVKAKAKNNFLVTAPSYRPDINSEIDLIEEIVRVVGYENIPKTIPSVKPQVSMGGSRDLVSLIKNILVGLGLNEVITYSLIDRDLLRTFKGPATVEILNPLSKEQEVLRPKLIPSLTRCVANNLNQKQEYINIFEIAKVFSATAQAPKEELALGISLCGIKPWFFGQGLVKDEAGLLHLKGILEALLSRLGIKDYHFNPVGPGIIAIDINQEKIGEMIRLSKESLEQFNIKNKQVFSLELSLDKLFLVTRLKKRFFGLPKYPGVARDISFILKEDVSVEDVLKAIEEKGKPFLENVKVVDYYKGKQIPPGQRGLTISCLYRSKETTLTEAQINPVHSLICSMLQEQFFAQLR